MPDRLVLWHRRVPAPRDDLEELEFHASWVRRVAGELESARGKVVALLGSTVAIEVDPLDVTDALDAALRLMEEAEDFEPSLKVCFGVALGELRDAETVDGIYKNGAALDRAQLLANRARPGELVLDPAAQELAASRYLFGRSVGTGAGGLKGQALDRAFPRRDDCGPAIDHLAPPPIPSTVIDGLARVTELAQKGGSHRLILRGPIGAGLREYIDVLAETHRPPLVLRLESVPGALEPLGSLRYALTRRWKTREGVEAAVGPLPGDTPETLAAIAKGIAVDRSDAVAAVSELLDSHVDGDRRPWVVADPLSAVDPATVGVVADAIATGTEALLLGRLPMDARPPKQLTLRGALEEATLPMIRTAGAREIAEVILGESTAEDVSRRVAVLGGTSPLGVLEAARALIAGGDLVRDGDAYRWRGRARHGVRGIPVESHIEERVVALDHTSRRILEAVCAAPSGSPSELARAVAMADGIDIDSLADAIDRLCTEAFLAPEEPLYATSTMLRAVVIQAMPAPRTSEMYRFIAGAMEAAAAKNAEFEKATVGYYLAEGGQEAEGARALIEAGRAAALGGFPRAAVRLAAAAVQYDPSPRTRSAATTLSRSVSARRHISAPPLPETVVAMAEELEETAGDAQSVGQHAVSCLKDRDFEAVDRILDIAVAEGHDRAAAERLRALTELGRGELEAALFAIYKSRDALPDDDAARARTELARAIILLGAGHPRRALRCALTALRLSRAADTRSGESASLRMLSLCYLALGRSDEAKMFAQA